MIPLAWSALAAGVAVCAFVYLGYPLVLLVASRLRPRPIHRAPIRPTLSVIVPVHNEAASVAAKLANTLAQDYPAERLELIVVSDGSTDATDDLVRGVGDPRLRLIEQSRQGKLPALTAGVGAARGEIVALTDANTLLAPGALAALVEPFADPEVGGVCGRKRYRRRQDDDTTGSGESAYWSFDSWLKDLESRVGSAFAADGALHALRRELYRPPADPAQADDIAISARVVLQGRRLVTEPRAVVTEAAPSAAGAEFARKVRVTNHSVRALLDLGSGLWRSGFYSFELVGHKLLRHLIPFFLVPIFGASALLAGGSTIARWLLAGQLAVYGLGLAGYLLRRTRLGRIPLLSLPYFFCLANAAALVGVLSIASGRRLAAWTPRGGPPSDSNPIHDPGDVDPMRKILAALLPAMLLAAAPAAAQDEPASPIPAGDAAPEADRVEWEAGLGANYYDNFFQVGEGEQPTEVNAGLLRFGGEGRLSETRPLSLRGSVEYLSYDEDLDDSTRAGLALRHRGDTHRWEIEGVLGNDVPNNDVGDVVDRVDTLSFFGGYSYRFAERLDAGLAAELSDQTHDTDPTRDSRLTKAGPFLRYRPSGARFSPEIGYLTGERDVDDDELSYDEDGFYALLRFTPTEAWYASLRYRDRERDYTIGDPLASNFARRDDRTDWTLSLAYRFAGRFGWNLYGTYLDADSTKDSRVFDTTTISSWLSYWF